MPRYALFLFPVLCACATMTPTDVARSALNYADALCFLANPELDEPSLLKACKIQKDLAPAVRSFVDAAAARAVVCKKP